MTEKERYENYKSKGICVNCHSRKSAIGKTMCELCLQKKRDREKENREFYLKNRFCPRCRKVRLYGNEKSCISCKLEMRELNNKAHERYIEQNGVSYWLVRKEKLKEQGLCVQCGREKLSPNSIYYCEQCLTKEKNRHKKIRAKKAKVNWSYINKSVSEKIID